MEELPAFLREVYDLGDKTVHLLFSTVGAAQVIDDRATEHRQSSCTLNVQRAAFDGEKAALAGDVGQ